MEVFYNMENTTNRDQTKIHLLRNGKTSLTTVNEFLEQVGYRLDEAEPIWFKSEYYGKPKMFIGDISNRLVFIGPYLSGDGIVVENNPQNHNVGEIRLKYPLPVLAGNSGKVLTVNETADGLEWKYTNIEHGTTEYWREHCDYVPDAGKMVIYDDAFNYDGFICPGLKIGNGNAYIGDLPFLIDEKAQAIYMNDFYRRLEQIENTLDEHINDSIRHITQEEREKWNNKINIKEGTEQTIENETLVFTRL